MSKNNSTTQKSDSDEDNKPVSGFVFWLLKLRVWAEERLHLKDLHVNLFYAALIGVTAGWISIGFRHISHSLTGLLTWSWPASEYIFSDLPWWQRLITPIIGGFVAGMFLWWGTKVPRSGNSTDYMEAVALGDGVVPFRYTMVKSGSALFTIASGGSIGREGPVVALCAMWASLMGRWTRISTPRLRLLVSCGAAAGMACVQNAPVGGALFAAEIVLGRMVMESFGPMVVASVIATQTIRTFIGERPIYDVPAFKLNTNWEMLPYSILGLLLGFIGTLYLILLRNSERAFSHVRIPLPIRLAIGGLIVGLTAILTPAVYGNGYVPINALFHGQFAWQMVLMILVLKLIATSATFGSGAVGGVFTPTLFVGAFLGYLFGDIIQILFPTLHTNPLAFALVGMGAFLTAATQTPLMSILMLVELTRDYQNILPLMIACVLAYYACLSTSKGASIYRENLKRKEKREGHSEPDWSHALIKDLMQCDPPVVTMDAGFKAIAEYFITTNRVYLYVTDEKGRFQGAISLHDVKPYLSSPELANIVIAQDITRENFLMVHPRDTLKEALAVFAKHDTERLPVVEKEKEKLVGSISKSDVILAIADGTKLFSSV